MLLPSVGARQFHGAVRDFGAGVGEEDAIEPGERGELLRERGLIAMVEQVRNVKQRLRFVA